MNRPARGCQYQVTTLKGRKIANGFVRLLLGDHGPYVEMEKNQMILSELKLKGRGNWFHHHHKECGLKVYDQTKVVLVPNPPQNGK